MIVTLMLLPVVLLDTVLVTAGLQVLHVSAYADRTTLRNRRPLRRGKLC